MKKLLTYFTTVILMHQVNAAVLTVNNMSGGPGQYTDVTVALNAANAGDTLYISPSSTSYGNLTIDKSITIIGKGSHADVQIPGNADFNSIGLIDSLSGVNILGLEINYFSFGIDCHLISIARCNFHILFTLNTNVTNCAISNCIFFRNTDCINGGAFLGISDILIQNNIFNGWIASVNGNNRIQNNLFLSLNTGLSLVSGALIQNNIFYFSDPAGSSIGCTFYNNITFEIGGNTFAPLGGNNIDNTDPLFVNNTYNGDPFSYAYNYDLQATSPGINAGTDSTDIGIYGGNSPMSTTGEPIGIPVIRKMEIQNFNVGQTGNVNVKVRSTKSRDH